MEACGRARSRQRERDLHDEEALGGGLLMFACIGTAIGAVTASAAPKQQKLTN